MQHTGSFEVDGYTLAADRSYDPGTNLWVAAHAADRVRIGFDPLGAETTGDVVAISFVPVGTRVQRGEPLATVEAAKFVGPVPAPIGGIVAGGNPELLANPARINLDPLAAWIAELSDPDSEDLEGLLHGEAAVTPWFHDAVLRFRRQGAIAQ
jgi:glycine cleavage system H protein